MKPFSTRLSGWSLVGSLLLLGVSELPVQAQSSAATREGYTLLKRGWVKDAIATFQQALRQAPNSLEAKLGLAIAYQRAGQDANAWQAYQQVLAQNPTQRTALAAIGQLGGYRPEWQATGIATLTTLLEATPDDLVARAQRALLLGYQGRFGEALADYNRVLQTNPAPEVLLGAAQVNTYSGNDAEALALFERYQKAGRSLPDGAISAYALTLQNTGNPVQAVQILNARLQSRRQLDDLSIEWRSALAKAYQAAGQPDKALAVLTPLRDQPQATLALARVLSAIARQSNNAQLFQESVALYQQALHRTANPSLGLVVEVADVLSEVPATRREALQLYQQATSTQPTTQPLQVKQLVLAHQLGELSAIDVSTQLQQALQPLPTQIVERRQIAIALLRLESPNPVLLPLYQALLESGVEVPLLQFRIAQMALQSGDLAAARTALAAYTMQSGNSSEATELLLAEIDRRESKLDASALRYEAILARDPVNVDALVGLGGVRFQQQRYSAAEALYQRVLVLRSQDLATRRVLADLYLAQDRPLAAFQQLRQIQQTQQNAAANASSSPAPADIAQELQDLRLNFLRRRGFQPYWERYK